MTRFVRINQKYVLYGVFGVLVSLQFVITIDHQPYFLTYYNPILGRADDVLSDNMFTGWGEGLNEAAIYLQHNPNIQEMEIITWYPLAFNWYSSGLGFEADPIYLDKEIDQDQLNDYLSADFAVIYINQWQRNYPQQLLEHLNAKFPEYTIQIKEVDYVRIYNLNQWECQVSCRCIWDKNLRLDESFFNL